MDNFSVRLARSKEEIDLAKRLRFEVFNIELQKGLKESYALGLDEDEYDEICDHIIIIDKEQDEVVGTYRLLLGKNLKNDGRFYSENEFDIGALKSRRDDFLELGRSCVHRDYRKGAVVVLLWQAILEYVKTNNAKYIIGCSSVYTTDLLEISKIYHLLKKKHGACDEFLFKPQPGRKMRGLKTDIDISGEEKEILLKIPALVRSYLKLGAKVCSEPVVDHEFGTVDFFMMLKVSEISKAFLKRFRLDNLLPYET